ncbi:MAG: hypothetical protein PHC62_00970 [Candidatus Izemoplasmatales bacterium]|nr:hypothetical protein [Candidatus Izemoplasmatales bacterium]
MILKLIIIGAISIWVGITVRNIIDYIYFRYQMLKGDEITAEDLQEYVRKSDQIWVQFIMVSIAFAILVFTGSIFH